MKHTFTGWLSVLLALCLLIVLSPSAMMEEVSMQQDAESTGLDIEPICEDKIESIEESVNNTEDEIVLDPDDEVVSELIENSIDEVEFDIGDNSSTIITDSLENDIPIVMKDEDIIISDEDEGKLLFASSTSSDIISDWYEYATYKIIKPFSFKTAPYDSASKSGGLQLSGSFTVLRFVENKYHNLWAQTTDNKYIYAGYKKVNGAWIKSGDQYIEYVDNLSDWSLKKDNLSGKKLKKGSPFTFNGLIDHNIYKISQIDFILAALEKWDGMGYKTLPSNNYYGPQYYITTLSPTGGLSSSVCSLEKGSSQADLLNSSFFFENLLAGQYRLVFEIHAKYDCGMNGDVEYTCAVGYPNRWKSNVYTIYAPFEVIESYTVENTIPSAPNYDDLKFTDVEYPKTYIINPSYGWVLGGGTVSSSSGLSTLKSEILCNDAQQTLVTSYGPISISGTSYAIKNINTGVKFSQITTPGNYIWRLTATDSAGHSVSHEMLFIAQLSGDSSNSSSSSSSSPDDESSLEFIDLRPSPDPTPSSDSNSTSDNGTNGGAQNGELPSDNEINGNSSSITDDGQTSTQEHASIPTITVAKKTVKATVKAGTQYKIDLNGATAKSFKSSKKKVAAVDANGVITPKTEGNAKITIKLANSKKRQLTLKVIDPSKPTKVSLNKTGTIKWYKQDPLTLYATLSPQNAISTIAWKTSNKRIATVNNGVLTFKKEGTVSITATTTKGQKMAKVKIKVIDGSKATSIRINQPSKTTIRVGETMQLSASAVIPRPTNSSNPSSDPSARWKSSSSKLIVNKYTGEITAVRPGTATITVTSGSGKKDRIKISIVE